MSLVDTNWLEENINNVKIIDCSWHMPQVKRDGFEEYKNNHIPNAIFFDLDSNSKKDTNLPHMLVEMNIWEKIVSKMGINKDDKIIIYDNSDVISSCRCWFNFIYFGHDPNLVHVLNGGLKKWMNEKKPTINYLTKTTNSNYRASEKKELVKDLNQVLENNPKNLMALKGIATLLAQFECESYDNCRPNEALELLDVALEDNPDDEDLKMKRDFLLSKAEQFDVPDTNGDYIVNIQFITRDQNGTLVSVIENSGTSVLPSRILEKYLDEKGKFDNTVEFKKEIVEINGKDYMKWHIVTEYKNEERFWRGTVSLEKRVDTKSDEGYDVLFFKEILRAIIPAQGYDVGYGTISILEFFKKI